MPSSYFIIEIDVHDLDAYKHYGTFAGPTVAKHGGKALVLGGPIEGVEGGWEPKKMVVLEFPTADGARNWYNSPEYQEALKLRQACATSKAVFAQGL